MVDQWVNFDWFLSLHFLHLYALSRDVCVFSLFRDQNICGFLSHFKCVENVIFLKFHMFRIQELFFYLGCEEIGCYSSTKSGTNGR